MTRGFFARRLIFLVLVVAVATVFFSRLKLGGGTTDFFVVHGEAFHDASQANGLVRPVAEGGYDGQFLTRLAFDPFHYEGSDFGIKFDRPAYRSQRILYPLVAWASVFGNQTLIPYALIGVNALSLFALYFLASAVLRVVSPLCHPIYPLLAAMLPGVLFSFGRNLSEPLGIVLAAAGLLGLLKRNMLLAFVSFALACLVRETFCLTVFAAGLWLGSTGDDPWTVRLRRTAMLWAAVLPMLCWQGWLYSQLGTTGPLDSPANLTLPMVGLVKQFTAWGAEPNAKSVANALYLVWHFVVAALVLFLLLRRPKAAPSPRDDGQRLLIYIWSILMMFSLCFSTLIWEDAWAFCRVMAERSVVSLLLIAISCPRPPWWLAAYSLGLSALSVLRLATRL